MPDNATIVTAPAAVVTPAPATVVTPAPSASTGSSTYIAPNSTYVAPASPAIVATAPATAVSPQWFTQQPAQSGPGAVDKVRPGFDDSNSHSAWDVGTSSAGS